MSNDNDFSQRCPVHLSKLDENGECSWCRIAQRLTPHRRPWELTADDIEFLRENGIDPEMTTPNALAFDYGGD